jgi:deoxyribonuclease V
VVVHRGGEEISLIIPPKKVSGTNVLIACVDVDYRKPGAMAAALWFRGWETAVPEQQMVMSFDTVADYEPGRFYKRELPCLLGVLERGPRPEIIVVDGYAWLGDGVAGLGAHLHHALQIPVIGVAKTRFATATDAVALLRGTSHTPLYVSAAGVSVDDAAPWIAAMHGPHRLPTLLKQVDRLAREASG